MDSNYIPINIGDPDISTKIAQFIANTPDIANKLNEWNSGVFDQPTYFSNIDVWKDCTPLVDAVTQLCSWTDVNHVCLHYFRQPLRHQSKTNYPSMKIWENCDSFQMVFPVLHWESDQYYMAIYNPLPGQEEGWDLNDDAVEFFPTIMCTTDEYWTDPTIISGYVTWLDNQVTETDRVSTVEPYQPFLHNMESIWAVHKINENAPGTLFLTVRVNAGCNLVENYNLIPK
jgi:hypothetical protein